MKFLNSLLLSAVCSFCLSFHALAHTHITPPLQPELVASEKASYLIAKTWFLPDYQGDTSSRSETNNNPGGEDIKGECGTYGLIAACASPKEPYGKKHPRQDLTCYTGCKCSEETYPFNSSNCNLSRYTLKGDNCDGLYKTCAPRSCPQGSQISCASNQVHTPYGSYSGEKPCYTCRDKTCADGGYISSVPTNQTCNSVSYAGLTCYRSCRNKTCADGGYYSSVPTNQTCTSVSYAGLTCYQSCRAKTCEERGYISTVPTNQTCTSVSFAGKTCYQNCRDKTCADGGYFASVPTNQTCATVSYAGNTCYQNCRAKTCADGGYVSSIPTNQTCTSVSYAGNTCYQNCRDLTCLDGGYGSEIPKANQICDTAYYAGLTCHSNCRDACGATVTVSSSETCTTYCNGNCVAKRMKTCEERGYTEIYDPNNNKCFNRMHCLSDSKFFKCVRTCADEYKLLNDFNNLLRSTYRSVDPTCRNMYAWNGGRFPITMRDDCWSFMRKMSDDMDNYNQICSGYTQISQKFAPSQCNTCAYGNMYCPLSACRNDEFGGGGFSPQL